MKIDMFLILFKDCDRMISVLSTVCEDLLRGEQVDGLTAVYEGLLISEQVDVHIASSCGCGTKHAMLLRCICYLRAIILFGTSTRRFSNFLMKVKATRTRRKKRKAMRKTRKKTKKERKNKAAPV